MEITTKFNPGDTVWTMEENKPHQFKINRIEIEIRSKCKSIYYVDCTSPSTPSGEVGEEYYISSRCFATKSELLRSFLSENEQI